RGLPDVGRLDAVHQLGPRRPGPPARGRHLQPRLAPRLQPAQPDRQRLRREHPDRDLRHRAGHPHQRAGRPAGRAQPRAPRRLPGRPRPDHRGAQLPPRDRGHPVRQGRGLRPLRGRSDADGLLDRLRRQAAGRGHRGDRRGPGRGHARHRRRRPQGAALRRVPPDPATPGGPQHLPVRQQPARLGGGGGGGRRRHRRHPHERLQALRLRLRPRHPAADHRHHPGQRSGERAPEEPGLVTSDPTLQELRGYRWRRFTPWQRLGRYLAYLATVAVLVWSVRDLDIFWPWVWDAPEQVADLLRRMYPPDWRRVGEIVRVLLETVNIATLAPLLALVFAVPAAYISARNTSPHPVLVWVGRFVLVASRSVNTIIWALLFVAIFGPGAVAGVAAIAVRSIGFIGKLISEAIEEIDPAQVEAIQATGA